MKQRLTFLFFLALMTALSPWRTLHAQVDSSHFGRDFWVALMPNAGESVPDMYYFYASSDTACNVTLTVPLTGWSQTMNVPAGGSAVYQVPTASNCYQAGSCIVTNRGVHVTSTAAIMLAVYNRDGSPCSSDATDVLPTHVLGSNYVLQTYPIAGASGNYCAGFSVLATEDNTTVHICLSGATSDGHQPGDTLIRTLNAGQIFQVKSPVGNGNFSGTVVRSDPSKPVSVFAGNPVARIPSGGISGDHIYIHQHPVEHWGKQWTLTPTMVHSDNSFSDYIRITALEDDCRVTMNGNTLTTLGALQSHEFVLSGACLLSTSTPAAVCQYLDSRHASSQGADYSDVAGFYVTPLEQMSTHAVFSTMPVDSRSPAVSQYWLNVAVPQGETSLLRLDGQPLSNFQPVSGSNYSHIRCSLNAGHHTLTTTGASGFTAHHYGVGENWESYNIAIGGNARHLQTSTLGGTNDTIDTLVCGSTFYFRGVTYTESGSWLLGGGCAGSTILNLTLIGNRSRSDTRFACDSFVWYGQTLRNNGYYTYYVPMPDGCDSTVMLNLTLGHTVHHDFDTSLCDSTLVWNDTLLTVPGEHTFVFATVEGCDSLEVLRLHRKKAYLIHIDTLACHLPIRWGDTLLAHDSLYRFRYTNWEGCDSIIEVHVRYSPAYDSLWNVSITDTESYIWVDGAEYTRSIDTVLAFTNIDGCDSLLRLHLVVIPIPRDPLLWVPNIITPDREGNRTFRIYCQDVEEATVSIYHRWGDRVCTFDGLTGEWDATKNGHPCAPGTYVYLIRYREKGTGKQMPEKIGTVTVLR